MPSSTRTSCSEATGQRPAHEGVRDRVVVAVEAEVRRLAGAHGAQELAGEGMLGERQEPGLLFGEGLPHGLVAAAGDEARMRDLGDPASQLGVEILDGAKRAGGEERMAQEAEESF